jgi:hypothetical protein
MFLFTYLKSLWLSDPFKILILGSGEESLEPSHLNQPIALFASGLEIVYYRHQKILFVPRQAQG